MRKTTIFGVAAILVMFLVLPTATMAGVGGAIEGVGGAGASHLRSADLTRLSSLRPTTEGVGGALEGVGGAVQGVGGAIDGVGGAVDGVGGALNLFRRLPQWLQQELLQIVFRR
jgi:hypothetical protein